MMHRSRGPALACAVMLALTGCQFGSDADRINRALPPGSEFLSARDTLFAAAKAHALDIPDIESGLAARMEQRANDCAGDFAPGLFDSDETIREKLVDKECFAKADAALVEWLGLRGVAIALAAPPLRPMAGTLASIETNGSASHLVFARRAGVAIASRASKTQVFDIASGETIARHDRTASGALSANGRVYAAQDGEALQLRDVESDALLLSLQARKATGFRFLGDAGALASVKDGDDGRRRLEYFDFRGGRRTPVATDAYLRDDIVELPGDGTRFLAASYGELIELQVVNGPEGAHVEVRRKLPAKRLPDGRMSLTADARTLPGVGANGLELLDVASMTSRAIPLSPLRPVDVAPTPDADKLVLTVFVPGDYKPQSYLYSLSARTLAPVDKTRAWGRITWLAALGRNAMVDGTRLLPLDAIPVGEAEDANAVMARAAEASAQHARAVATPTIAQDSTTSLRRAGIERAIRENNLPPAEAERLRQWVATVEAKSAMPPRAQNSAGSLRVPENADVRAVGVYEAEDGSHGVGKERKAGTVRVFVSRSARPIVLVLTSYEPVNWSLHLQNGAKVSNVLLSSYHSSQVFGAGDARIDSIGTQYAYKRGSSDFDALDAQVQRFTGKRIGSFQGAYSGTSFSLGY